jgi:ABC-type lipoprotein release transport system permease subunit
MLTLILKELKLRKLGALISVVTIAIALICIIAAMETMRQFDLHTDKQLAELDQKTEATTKKLNDQIRRTMKGLGFNIYIYPAQQDLAEVYAKGYASNTMPENYAKKLADSAIVTVNHLLPQLSRRVLWKEKNAEIMLIGVDGQVPIAHRNPKKPIMRPVPKGSAIVGSELAKHHQLKLHDSISLNGQSFTIKKIHPQRGTIDDITVWIPLDAAQQMLNLPNRINAILALGCNCASIDRLGTIRKELNTILPDTQIIEIESKALARAEARNKVKTESQATRQNIIANRTESRKSRTTFLSILTPLILMGSLTGLFTLCLFNVRERRSEIGTLLSIGVPSGKIFTLFLGRAFIIGVAGTLLTLGVLLLLSYPLADYWHITLLAPILTLISAWLPTLTASRKDPLDSLKQG